MLPEPVGERTWGGRSQGRELRQQGRFCQALRFLPGLFRALGKQQAGLAASVKPAASEAKP